jgi:hypothetical protein
VPRLNRLGTLWCAGIAGAGFSCGDFVNDRANAKLSVPRAGGRAFLNDEEAVTSFHDEYEIRAYNAQTGEHRYLFTQPVTEVDAGGGIWGVFVAFGRPGGESGVRVSTGLRLPTSYLGAATGPMRNDCIGPDGSVAVRDHYHSLGPWHVYPVNGDPWLLALGDITNVQLLGGQRAIWREGWVWGSHNIETPKPLTRIAWGLKILETPEGTFIVYQAEDGRVVAHLNGESRGYVLGSAVDAFGIDAIYMADGRFRVVWATTEGEAPDSIVTEHFRPSDPRAELRFGGVVDPPPPPPPPPPQGDKMRVPERIYEIYEQVFNKYPDLFFSKEDEGRREGHRRALATIKSKRPPGHERLVWKTAHSNGASPSKDAMGYVPAEVPLSEIRHLAKIRMLVWDMVIGAPRGLKPNHENDYDLTDQYVVLEGIDPHDYLDEDGPVDPVDPVDPPPTGEPRPIGRTVKHKWWRGDTEPRDDCNHPMTDGGDCDRGKGDPIHDFVPPVDKPPVDKPPVDKPPVDKPPVGDATLAQILAEVRETNEILKRHFK